MGRATTRRRPSRPHRTGNQDRSLTRHSDAWRHINIGRLLNNAIQRFETRVFELLAAAGHSEARLPHLNLTRFLDADATRIVELARRAKITKQAMSELIAQCEKLGLIKSTRDPSDARAKIVEFSARGLEWLNAFRAALEQAEREMRVELGATRMDGLKRLLKLYAGNHDTLGSSEDPAALSIRRRSRVNRRRRLEPAARS